MTKEQIEKKALDVYPEEPMTLLDGMDTNVEKREGYTKALTEIEELPKIKGWVARDKCGELYVYSNFPFRSSIEWRGVHGVLIQRDEYFSDLKWEDDPIEVELIIRPYSK